MAHRPRPRLHVRTDGRRRRIPPRRRDKRPPVRLAGHAAIELGGLRRGSATRRSSTIARGWSSLPDVRRLASGARSASTRQRVRHVSRADTEAARRPRGGPAPDRHGPLPLRQPHGRRGLRLRALRGPLPAGRPSRPRAALRPQQAPDRLWCAPRSTRASPASRRARSTGPRNWGVNAVAPFLDDPDFTVQFQSRRRATRSTTFSPTSGRRRGKTARPTRGWTSASASPRTWPSTARRSPKACYSARRPSSPCIGYRGVVGYPSEEDARGADWGYQPESGASAAGGRRLPGRLRRERCTTPPTGAATSRKTWCSPRRRC